MSPIPRSLTANKRSITVDYDPTGANIAWNVSYINMFIPDRVTVPPIYHYLSLPVSLSISLSLSALWKPENSKSVLGDCVVLPCPPSQNAPSICTCAKPGTARSNSSKDSCTAWHSLFMLDEHLSSGIFFYSIEIPHQNDNLSMAKSDSSPIDIGYLHEYPSIIPENHPKINP